MFRRWVAFSLIVAMLEACSSRPLRGITRVIGPAAEKGLAAGLRSYEDGEYENAARQLQSSIDAGLSLDYDKINAHKHLAFVHCISNRERECREEFRKLLELDPKFDLEKSEAGHPIWGPVFRSVRARK
jgi:Tfp pilus assembly protein PilF